jgi:hypothetical protein
VIYLDNTAAKWKKLGHSFFAIDAKKDFSDLPNYKIIRAPITNIEKCAEGYKITLGVKMPRDIAKGTTVRQHISGGYIWQMCDARSDQDFEISRPRGCNNKGILDQYRHPKRAYRTVQKIYGEHLGIERKHYETALYGYKKKI